MITLLINRFHRLTYPQKLKGKKKLNFSSAIVATLLDGCFSILNWSSTVDFIDLSLSHRLCFFQGILINMWSEISAIHFKVVPLCRF